ncbi:hypothetical protein chiPu_0003053 [Chiloscyllium punctatum]|uniref:Uncharacterized protein n=1 Tax=Chiloscyllium punctatum TaxID=137246 RepID=A0A401S2M8_CHIPU|nr:hypothetical protein [Chiloscyllium punctatum]
MGPTAPNMPREHGPTETGHVSYPRATEQSAPCRRLWNVLAVDSRSASDCTFRNQVRGRERELTLVEGTWSHHGRRRL